MIGKIKPLFKVSVVSIVMVLILFGIYRREYISQAIPVYMQYLEQRSKWEDMNTGTYVYFDPPLYTYFFIKDNKLSKTMRYGNAWKPKYVKPFEHSYLFNIAKEDSSLYCFFKNKEYLIEKRFDAISRLILIKGFMKQYASTTKCDFNFTFMDLLKNNDNLFYEIGYNKHYGYPMIVYQKSTINEKSLTYLPQRPSQIQDLIMLPAGTQYTNKVLKQILDYYGKQDILIRKHDMPKLQVINIVGGNMIKSGLFDKNETFQLYP